MQTPTIHITKISDRKSTMSAITVHVGTLVVATRLLGGDYNEAQARKDFVLNWRSWKLRLPHMAKSVREAMLKQ